MYSPIPDHYREPLVPVAGANAPTAVDHLWLVCVHMTSTAGIARVLCSESVRSAKAGVAQARYIYATQPEVYAYLACEVIRDGQTTLQLRTYIQPKQYGNRGDQVTLRQCCLGAFVTDGRYIWEVTPIAVTPAGAGFKYGELPVLRQYAACPPLPYAPPNLPADPSVVRWVTADTLFVYVGSTAAEAAAVVLTASLDGGKDFMEWSRKQKARG